jgi:hypothetical protein
MDLTNDTGDFVSTESYRLARALVRRLGMALDHQNEAWGLYGQESKDALKAFKDFMPNPAICRDAAESAGSRC